MTSGTNKNQPQICNEYIIIIFLTLFSALFHFWRLAYPDTYVFDEAYYAKFAAQYLSDNIFFDTHPPLGSVIISQSISLFGDNALAWRFIPALLGTLVVPISYFVSKKIFNNSIIGLFTALLLTVDGLFLVHTRLALLGVFVAFFVMLAYLLFLYYRDTKNAIFLTLSAVSIGCALASQWLAVPFLLVLIVWAIVVNHHNTRKAILSVVCFVLVPAIIYVLVFALMKHPDTSFWSYFAYWHERAWDFHANLRGDHVLASRWYTWLYLFRPMRFLIFESGDRIATIMENGNPVIWWSGIIAYIYGLYVLIRYKTTTLLVPILSFSLYYFGWCLIAREQFLYYMLPALPFYFMILAYALYRLSRINKGLVAAWILVAVVAFLFFYPSYVARPISTTYYNALFWFESWR